MRLLALDQYSELGGAQHCLLDLAPALAAEGHVALAAAPRGGPLLDRLGSIGLETRILWLGDYASTHKPWSQRLRFAADTLATARQVRRLIREFSPDLLYVNGPRLLPAAALVRGRVPILFHCHSRLWQRSAIWAAGASLASASAAWIACCHYAAEPLRPFGKLLRILYNGVPGPPALRQPQIRASPRIGLIGRIAPEKGQADFIASAGIVVRARPDCRFLLCGEALFGDPVSQAYREQARRSAVGLPVEFLGWRDDVHDLLPTLDLLVAPSTREPATTRVILEAFAHGVPVIAYATGGIPEALRDGEGGFLVKPPTPAALADRILTTLALPAERIQALREAGRRTWRQRFTVQRYQREALEAIDEAAASA